MVTAPTQRHAGTAGCCRIQPVVRIMRAPLVILTAFVSVAVALGFATGREANGTPSVERRSGPLQVDSGADGYVDSVRRFVIGEREYLVITFWVRWGMSTPVFVWTAAGDAQVSVTTYKRSDLAAIQGAMAATITASRSYTSTDDEGICFGIEGASRTYFVTGFENCWSFEQ